MDCDQPRAQELTNYMGQPLARYGNLASQPVLHLCPWFSLFELYVLYRTFELYVPYKDIESKSYHNYK